MSSRCSISFDIDSEKDLIKLQKMLQSDKVNATLDDVLNGGGKDEIMELIKDLDHADIPEAIRTYLKTKLYNNFVSLELISKKQEDE